MYHHNVTSFIDQPMISPLGPYRIEVTGLLQMTSANFHPPKAAPVFLSALAVSPWA